MSELPGWNDPPPLPQNDTISTTRVLLNKRISYTNQDLSTNSSPSKSDNGIQPPPPPPSTVTSHTNYVKSAEETKTNSIDEITEQFNQQFKKLEDAEIERKILDDITKKFQILVDDWKQNKLTLSTKEKLSELFENLDHNLGLAFDLHVGLVRNSGAEVVRFIVGIKRLIQELQRISTLSENTTNKSNEVSPN